MINREENKKVKKISLAPIFKTLDAKLNLPSSNYLNLSNSKKTK